MRINISYSANFNIILAIIDSARRAGNNTSLYLLLGSASVDLLKQAGETLAGRAAYLKLNPFNILEVKSQQLDALWTRSGFPQKFLAANEARSSRWRKIYGLYRLTRFANYCKNRSLKKLTLALI